ncbi:Ig-like domain-containing protein [Aeromicrobium sp.]|uniref:L,D-transpeptidase n=1 Tax=Aeromicrobium sp. TaxID=1871063 RepID=UPI0019B156DC|nr:Ig-like domain-containing protein [Aeromicrobium sp.]MBC7629968.1 L,D-transpeptidase family protein [Aeromicrobium sp.]
MRDPRFSAVAACAALVVLSACSAGAVRDVVTPDEGTPKDSIVLTANVAPKADGVEVKTIVSASATHGIISTARLATVDGKTTIAGSVAGSSWVAGDRLEPSTTYRLSVTGRGDDGKEQTLSRTFSTQALSLAQQTYPSVAPLRGETVGVGMPVIVTFDVPVKNRALFERNMTVESTPAVRGSWDWFSDREVHFRPQTFWPAHARVNVSLRLNGLPAGGGVYGQQDQDIDFKVGREIISVVNIAKHRLKYTVDGRVGKTIPVTTGDSGHATREGTKVIMEKFSSIDMDAATTGVDSEDPGYYNIKDVRWAMRVTNSGEFLHAAPWSVGAQGSANVSHGCTGMSTADAAWLFQHSRRGDVVRYVNGSRQLEDRNGWTDWNVPWSEWVRGSALS